MRSHLGSAGLIGLQREARRIPLLLKSYEHLKHPLPRLLQAGMMSLTPLMPGNLISVRESDAAGSVGFALVREAADATDKSG